jgi:hypothetical protein
MKAGTFALLLAAPLACSSQTPPCNFTTCSGCCDSVGVCESGDTPASCGSNGGQCLVCPGGVCQLGQCTFVGFDAGPPCNSSTCFNGCCAGSQCINFPDQSSGLCGSFGQFCFPCPGAANCIQGTCFVQKICPALCPAGCCDNDGGCFSGTDPLHCGPPGTLCASCNSFGDICQGGVCVPGNGPDSGVCNASTCPTGCCNSTACVAPGSQSNNQCGLAGAACAACGAGGECQGGVCSTVPCMASNCSGCCDGWACIDLPLERDFACGQAGAACSACPGGSSCQLGQCR